MPSGHTILVVDDEAGILRLLRLELTTQGYDVIAVSSGDDAIATASTRRIDLALVDIVMPGMSGLDVLRAMKQRWKFPVLLLTARGSDADRAAGMELGADDYVLKPFSPEDLSSRIRHALREDGSSEQEVVRAGRIVIDLSRRLVRRNEQPVHLTATEWRLLEVMARGAPRVIPNERLLSSVWGAEYARDIDYLKVWMSRLRRKLGDNTHAQTLLKAPDGSGYFLHLSAS